MLRTLRAVRRDPRRRRSLLLTAALLTVGPVGVTVAHLVLPHRLAVAEAVVVGVPAVVSLVDTVRLICRRGDA